MSNGFTDSALIAERHRSMTAPPAQELTTAQQKQRVQIVAARALLADLKLRGASDPFLAPREIRRIYPSFTYRISSSWSVFCPLLAGRPQKKRRRIRWTPAGKRKRRYSFRDVDEAFQNRDFGPAQDDFENKLGHWIWTNLLRQDVQKERGKPVVKRPALETVADWNQNGHPAFANKPGKPQIITRYFWPEGGQCHSRDYVRVEDLDKVEKFVADADGRAKDAHWMDRAESESLVYKTTRAKFSDHTHHNRRRRGVPHPALGRTIKTEVVKAIVNGKRVSQVWRWREDVNKVRSFEMNAEEKKKWATFKNFKTYCVSLAQVLKAVERGEVGTYDFPAVPERSRHDEQTRRHFFREHLKALGERIKAKKDRGRPATVGKAFFSIPYEPDWPSSHSPVKVWDEEQTNQIALRLTGVDYSAVKPTANPPAGSELEATAIPRALTQETCTRQEAAVSYFRSPGTISKWADEFSEIVASRQPNGRVATLYVAKLHAVSIKKRRRESEAEANDRMDRVARRLASAP